MTMRLTQLATHWEPDEALAMIQLLDQLKEQLWSVYAEEIIRQEYASQKHRIDKEQLALDFDDPSPF
jgi:c-di-GMP-binding flagellar brake protein YcgR